MGRALVIDIQTKDAQTLAALKRIEGGLGRVDKSVGKVKTSGLGMGDALEGVALAAGISYVTNEFEEAETAAASTTAVIKSTGNAAQVSAGQQDKLVASLSKLAGVDDDIVTGGANMLRTFTDIKDENFGEALAASMDIAAMKGQDLASTAEMVGKALNDPVTGYTKLTRAGVVFTDQQIEMIKTLDAAGDKAGAQKVILDELAKEYGGQAEAFATSSGRMKVAAGEAAESVGAILAPAIEKAATAVAVVSEGFTSLPPSAQTAALALGGVAVVAKKIQGNFGDASGSLRNFGSNMSGLDKTLVAATAGVTSYTLALTALENSVKFEGDVQGLNQDLVDLGAGKTDIAKGLYEMGGSVEDLADAFDKAGDAPDNYGEALLNLIGPGGTLDLKTTSNIKDAQNKIEALDTALADAASNGHAKEAAAAYDQITAALVDQGLTYDEIVPYLPKYTDAADRASRSAGDQAAATDDLTEATSDYGASLKDAIDGSKDHRDAMTDELDAMFRLHAEARKGIDGVMSQTDARSAYENAVLSVTDAQQSLNDTLNDSEATQNDVAQARQRLTDAIVSQANAADDLAQANATAEGTQYDAGQAAIVLQGEFEKARQTTGFWNDDLQTTVDGLEDVSKPYKIQLDAQRALSDMHDLIAAMLTVIGLWGHVVTTVGDEIATGVSTIIGVVESGPTKTGNLRSGATINVENMRVSPESRDLDFAFARAGVRTGRRVLAGAW